MTPADKQRFVELAEKDAERYQSEMTAFGGEDVGRKRKRGKKDVNAPKRPLSAFFFFSKVKRSEVQQAHPEWRVGQVAQELGRQWKDLTEPEKRKYEEMVTRDKSRYEVEMRDYKAGGGGGGKKPAGRGGASASAASHADDDGDDDEDDEEDDDE